MSTTTSPLTPETDALAVVCYGEGGIEASYGFRAVPIKDCRKLERERDEARDQLHAMCEVVKACMAAMPVGNVQTHTPENLAARIGDLASALASQTSENEAMCEAIREVFNSFADEPASDSAWLLDDRQTAALTKLQPFIAP